MEDLKTREMKSTMRYMCRNIVIKDLRKNVLQLKLKIQLAELETIWQKYLDVINSEMMLARAEYSKTLKLFFSIH